MIHSAPHVTYLIILPYINESRNNSRHRYPLMLVIIRRYLRTLYIKVYEVIQILPDFHFLFEVEYSLHDSIGIGLTASLAKVF